MTTTLIGIDITLAGLFWAMGGEDDVIGRFLKKILYVGAFALIIGSFSTLAEISSAPSRGSGLQRVADASRPMTCCGRGIASAGFDAAKPLLEQVSQLTGFPGLFENFLTIAVLMTAWLFVILAFFLLSVQLFITIIEFKLTTLAGFVLVPFALWNRTSFLAERVLGNVIASGIKVMVLAIIVGIGSGFFTEFRAAAGKEVDLSQAMSLVLASLALFGLGIFGPSIASGLVAGAPQLGAGAAVGTAAAAVGTMAVGGGALVGGARAIGGGAIGAVRAGTAMGSAASTAYRLGQETSGERTIGAGLAGVAGASSSAARQKFGEASGIAAAVERGQQAALFAGAARPGGSASTTKTSPSMDTPQWARRLRSEQAQRNHRHSALQAIREGERGGASANPDIKEKEE